MAEFPTQERIYRAEVEDSARWQDFSHRPGDIFICTAPKNGTTWTQAICSLLIFGDPDAPSGSGTLSPWIELTMEPMSEFNARVEAQTHRRFIKSHAPMDGIIWWADAVYIAVCRHPLDMYFSVLKHGANQSEPGENPVYNVDPVRSFDYWLNEPLQADPTNNTTFEAAVHHFQSFRRWQHLPNVHLFHYADLKRDLPGQMTAIADAIGVSHPPALMRELAQAATFDAMRSAAERHAPEVHDGYWKDKRNFFDSGTSGKWVGKLSDDQIAAYDARMAALLTPDDRCWLEWGAG